MVGSYLGHHEKRKRQRERERERRARGLIVS